MNYLPTQDFQLKGFLYSILLGLSLGIFYDLLKIIFFTLTLKRRKLTNARDIFFFIVALLSTFIYLLVMCEGQVLFYALVGELFGYSIYHFTIGKMVFDPIFNKFSKKIERVVLKTKAKIKNITKNLKIFEKNQKKT